MLSNNSFGKIEYNSAFSTIITGIFVIGSFRKFPVSNIAFTICSFSNIFIFILYITSFFFIFDFTILKAICVITKPITPPNSAILIGYVPIYTPFFINTSCGLTKYNSANAHPPNENDTR